MTQNELVSLIQEAKALSKKLLPLQDRLQTAYSEMLAKAERKAKRAKTGVDYETLQKPYLDEYVTQGGAQLQALQKQIEVEAKTVLLEPVTEMACVKIVRPWDYSSQPGKVRYAKAYALYLQKVLEANGFQAEIREELSEKDIDLRGFEVWANLPAEMGPYLHRLSNQLSETELWEFGYSQGIHLGVLFHTGGLYPLNYWETPEGMAWYNSRQGA
jgi:hypothetical protein